MIREVETTSLNNNKKMNGVPALTHMPKVNLTFGM